MRPPPRKSSTINLLLLGGGMLALSTCCVCSGCGRHEAYDPQWHDAQGQVVAKEYATDDAGHRHPAQPVFDENGKPIAFDQDGNPIPPAGTTYSSGSSHGSSYHYRSGGGWFFPYIFSSRSPSYGPSYTPRYRSGPTNTGSTYFGGSKPNSSAPPTHASSGGSSSSGSVSRGGFGGGAAAHSSSSAS